MALGKILPVQFLLLYYFISPAGGQEKDASRTPIEINNTLQLVQVVFRHGNCTPEFPYYNDPNAYESFHPYSWDDLDQAGHQRAYNLGRYLKHLYGDFIPEQHTKNTRILTTDTRPAKLSAQLVAAGLYPPPEELKWGPPGSLGDIWQPTWYQFLPLDKDNLMYMNGVPCPAYSAELKVVEEGPEAELFIENNCELFEAVDLNARVPSNRSIAEVARLSQTLMIEDFNNLTVPDWAKPFHPEGFLSVLKMHFKMNSWNRKLQRLQGGPLLGHIIQQMEMKAEGSNTKIWLYSGHDYTVANVGMAAKIWGDFYPDFCSAIIVELHANSAKEFFVKTYFHNDTSKPPMKLTVPGCQEFCPLAEFRRILNDSIPENHTAECFQMSRSAAIRPAANLLMSLIIARFILR